jgi:uncharacterized protein YdhG (YjbR/CyaY superfamily)
VSRAEIDEYLAGLDPDRRAGLERLRADILAVLPDAEEGLSYRLPAFRVDGKVVAGFAAFTRHLSYLPHSGSVLAALAGELEGYTRTTGSLHVPIDAPLPAALVRRLVETRRAELDRR